MGLEQLGQPQFWLAVLEIIWINVLLSGDNAVVIALACRNLPDRERVWGMILGAGVAVALRIAFTGIVATLMTLPFIKIIGGLALLYVAVKLLLPAATEEEAGVHGHENLWRAVRMVAVADLVMSLDNVIAIAAAAKDNYALLVLGLGISIPLIVAGAALVMALLARLPALVWAGAALLGWIAGGVIATDPVVQNYELATFGPDIIDPVAWVAALGGAVLVPVAGGAARRQRRGRAPESSKAPI